MEIPNYEKMEGWKSFDYNFEKNEVVGFVAPTYFWGIPKNVKEFLEKISINGQSYLFYVSTYGTTTGQSCQRLSYE